MWKQICKIKNNEVYFSQYNHAWGWATWRKSWKNFDPSKNFGKNMNQKNGKIEIILPKINIGKKYLI